MTVAPPRAVRVVVVDDHAIVRAGLAALLAAEPDLEVAGVAASAEEALSLAEAERPDIAVVDYRLPGACGIELCAALIDRHPGTRVIMLSSCVDDDVVLRAVEAGASAYVYKDVDGVDLKRAIRQVASGRATRNGANDRSALAEAHRRTGPYGEVLSLREVEVLRLVAAGGSNPQVATELGLSPGTVKTYLRRAGEKLGAHNRAEAAAAAIKRGLL